MFGTYFGSITTVPSDASVEVRHVRDDANFTSKIKTESSHCLRGSVKDFWSIPFHPFPSIETSLETAFWLNSGVWHVLAESRKIGGTTHHSTDSGGSRCSPCHSGAVRTLCFTAAKNSQSQVRGLKGNCSRHSCCQCQGSIIVLEQQQPEHHQQRRRQAAHVHSHTL